MHVTSDQLMERLNEATILDVRTPAEFEAVHIPGSFNLPLDRLPEHVNAVGSAVNNPVVLVCRSGQRAREAEQCMLAADVPGVQVLDGGLGAWEGAGLPVVRGKTRWSMERQVRGVAGGIVLASLVGSLVARPLALVAAGVGAGLLFSAVTDTCTMARVLGRLPYNQADGCDVSDVLRDLARRQETPASSRERVAPAPGQ